MNEKHLIIFVKNPVAGRVKTRLAAGIGNQKALEIYLHLLAITRTVATKINCTRHVFYSDEIDSDEWDEDQFNKHLQKGDSLGDIMNNAFETVFTLGAKKAVIIGSDCPELTSEIVDSAFKALAKKEIAIGPAKDGGYYLLGMQKPLPFLFDDKQWSTDSVFDDTIVDLMENRLSYERLPVLSDLDTIYDLHLLKGELGN